MNTGIQDAFDVGWKVAWVLRGWAPPALLDTADVANGRTRAPDLPRGGPIQCTRRVARDSGVVRSAFDAVPGTTIRELVEDRWALDLTDVCEVTVGAGAYHWSATGRDGRRWFITCDDLGTKPWLGDDHDVVFDGLAGAYGAAIELATTGASFVVAPRPSRSRAATERLDGRHGVAVFEHVDGVPGEWGQRVDPAETDELVTMLATLHRCRPASAAVATRPLALPGRAAFDALLSTVHRPWDGGPLAEPARRRLEVGTDAVASWLAALDGATRRSVGAPTVLTHGEPHPGNLIRTPGGLRLVDWDTVALAPPERDLWMLTEVAPGAADRYAELTGTVLDDELLGVYRLLWALADVASYAAQLHAAHAGNADDHHALAAITSVLDGREPTPYRPHRPARG